MLRNPIVTFMLLAVTYAVPTLTFSQYSLVVSEEPSVMDGMTKFRLYIQLSDSTDQVSAIFGTDKNPMSIVAPKGVFNSPFNASWSASGLNPNFFEAMPSMVDDSFATIGLDGPASNGNANSEDPIMVDDRSNPWAEFFKVNEVVKLEINTLLGGSWFVLKTASNGFGDENLRVLIAQITTPGTISGIINAQIFPLGDGKKSVKMSFSFDGLGTTPGAIVLE